MSARSLSDRCKSRRTASAVGRVAASSKDPLNVRPIQRLRATQVTIRRVMKQGPAVRVRFCVPVDFATVTIFKAFVIFTGYLFPALV
jgi:hypothetical protein